MCTVQGVDHTYQFDKETKEIAQQILDMKQTVENHMKTLEGGGRNASYTKTPQKILFKGRERVLYVGKRGGKYVKMKNEMLRVSPRTTRRS